MDVNQSSVVFEDRFEDVIDETTVLSLQMDDDEINRALGRRLENAESFWNSAPYKLDETRKRNVSYWDGSYFDSVESSLYKHQTPYQENLVFVNVETLVPMVLSRPPQPVVTAANNSEASRELADSLGDVLLSFYDNQYLRKDFMTIGRHLLSGMRVALHKYRWDNTVGSLIAGENGEAEKSGDIIIDVPYPSKVVLSERATNPDDIGLIAEYMEMTIEEMGFKFDKKKDQLLKEVGITRGVATQMHKILEFPEIWFSYFNKKGVKSEAVAWKYKTVVLGSMKNPNWNYEETATDDEGNLVSNNYFEKPKKPYVLYNHLNLGKYVIDDTSLTEQARLVQETLDKRGRQIVDNADAAGSTIVYDETKISEETMAQYTGHPREKIGVNGDVNGAITRVPPPPLPNYVVQDKQDIRNTIDNIFGAHAPIKGSDANSPTLGQEVLSQRSDLSRIQALATSVEDGADRLYKGLTQMMKVFYDTERTIKFTGEAGATSFVKFSSRMIEDGIAVRVKTGSVLPDDPVSKANVAMKMAAVLDPLTLGEQMGVESPKEFAKRVMFFRLAPDKYMAEFLQTDPMDSGQDPSAMQEQEAMVSGQPVPPQQNPSKAHLATHQAFISSPQFQELTKSQPEVASLIIEHIEAEKMNAQTALHQETEQPQQPPQPPTPGMSTEEAIPPQNPDAVQNTSIFQRIMNRLKGGDR